MISRRKLLLGGLLLTGGLVAGNSKKIAGAKKARDDRQSESAHDGKSAKKSERKAASQSDRKVTSGDTFEAAVIGGGFAGLQAALTLGRACRTVILFDSGAHRNNSNGPFHNFLGRDGANQADFFAEAREQLKQYDVTICKEKIVSAIRSNQNQNQNFTLKAESGIEISSSTILIATGVRDQLPQIKGISEFWGKGVYYCPFCNGWEVRDKLLAVLGKGDGGANAAIMLTGWSKKVVLLTNGEAGISPERSALLRDLKIEVIADKITALEGKDVLETIVLVGDKKLHPAAVFIQPVENHDSPLLNSLAVRLNNWGLPALDPRGETSVKDVFVAGDASGKPFQAIGAAADGAAAAFAMSRSLIFDPLQKRKIAE